MPVARPTRNRGKSSSVSVTATKASAASSNATGSVLTNITASPMVLISRTGPTATSRAASASRFASRSRSSGGTASPNRVNPTRSANATVTDRAPGSGKPSARSEALTASFAIAWRSCTNNMSEIMGPSSGTTSATSSSEPSAISSSVAPGRSTAASAAYRMTSAARPRPSASMRVICTIWSGSMPISMNRCANDTASASARRCTAASGSSTVGRPIARCMRWSSSRSMPVFSLISRAET